MLQDIARATHRALTRLFGIFFYNYFVLLSRTTHPQ